MATYEDAIDAVTKYERRFRRSDLEELERSGLYDLFPSEGNVVAGVTARWTRIDWPNADSPGVYLIFDENLQLLYVGKASLKSTLGGRLQLLPHRKGW